MKDTNARDTDSKDLEYMDGINSRLLDLAHNLTNTLIEKYSTNGAIYLVNIRDADKSVVGNYRYIVDILSENDYREYILADYKELYFNLVKELKATGNSNNRDIFYGYGAQSLINLTKIVVHKVIMNKTLGRLYD